MQNSGLGSSKQVAKFKYRFAQHGGAVGAIAVSGDGIPAGSIITSARIHCPVAGTSGGAATVAVMAVGAGDVLAATAIASFALNASLVGVPVPQTANTWIRAANAITSITVTVAAAALTAGEFVIALDYDVLN
jgi:hypothetical protein